MWDFIGFTLLIIFGIPFYLYLLIRVGTVGYYQAYSDFLQGKFFRNKLEDNDNG